MKQIKIKDVLPWLIILVGAYFLVREINKEPEVLEVPVEIKVPVPSIKKEFDTIYKPKPVPVKEIIIDSTYYEEYKALKDSVAKDSLFKEAIKINDYQVTFEDSIQKIEVFSKVRGELLNQKAQYETKPRTLIVNDTIRVPNKFKAYLGVEAGVPLAPTMATRPVAKVNLMVKFKNSENPWTISGDTEGRIWVGKIWKIRLRGKN